MFTPVFAQILDSSLMDENLETRWLFLTMLILADEAQTGVVDMPISRLAIRASLSVEATRKALERLMAPDPDSRSEEEDGRRVIPLPREDGFSERGWIIVNWEKYKTETKAAIRREAVRLAVARHRHRKRGCPGCAECYPADTRTTTNGQQESSTVIAGNHVKSRVAKTNTAEAEATTEAEEKRARKPRFVPPTVEEVEAFAAEYPEHRGQFNPSKFVAHYRAIGWKVGRNKMEDWRAKAFEWMSDPKV